jgi:hypothetical protein
MAKLGADEDYPAAFRSLYGGIEPRQEGDRAAKAAQ